MAEPNQTTTYSLAEEFDTLPEAIKTWLASDHATIYVSEINKKLGIKGERRGIIPTLVLRLVTKDLEPRDFIPELAAELNIGQPIAKSLAEEIEAKILHPIELGLRRDAGVDIKLIYLGETAEKTVAPAAPPVTGKIPPPTAEISRPPIPPITKPQLPTAPTAPEEKPAISPRIIYRERDFQAKPEIKPASARIVHYSNLITPLSNSESEMENNNSFLDSFVVDLRNT